MADGFAVRCTTGGRANIVRGTHVINATGIVSAPRLPDDVPPRHDRTDPRDAQPGCARRSRRGRARLLVVGGGASAADVLANWLRVRQPGDRAWLSLRSPLKAVPSHLLGLDLHYVTWLPEHLPARPLGPRLGSRDTMFGLAIPRAIRAASSSASAPSPLRARPRVDRGRRDAGARPAGARHRIPSA